jgi:hypothetical protein
MINRGMDEIKNNPYFKKKVDDEETDEAKESKATESIMVSKGLMAEQVEDTVVLSKIGPQGHKEAIKTLDVDSALGRQLSDMIDKENMTEEDVLAERIKEITLNSKRLNLANYL